MFGKVFGTCLGGFGWDRERCFDKFREGFLRFEDLQETHESTYKPMKPIRQTKFFLLGGGDRKLMSPPVRGFGHKSSS